MDGQPRKFLVELSSEYPLVKFDPLSIYELQKIIILQTEDLKSLLLEQKIDIIIDKKVINKIANDSYEPEYGARPLAGNLEDK